MVRITMSSNRSALEWALYPKSILDEVLVNLKEQGFTIISIESLRG